MDTRIWQEWARAAAGHVKFRPDREGIFRELMHHMEDRAEALKEEGVPEEEAVRTAVASMGDPDEVGKQLNAVHKPWLGRLWMISKVLVILAVLATVLLSLARWALWPLRYDYHSPKDYIEDLRDGDPSHGERLYYSNAGGPSAPLDGHTVRVEQVSLWDYDGEARVYLLLSVDGFLPWQRELDLSNTYAVDSHGKQYRAYGSANYRDAVPQVYTPYSVGRTPTVYYYGVVLARGQRDVDWVELRYDRAGRDLALRVNLPGGEER